MRLLCLFEFVEFFAILRQSTQSNIHVKLSTKEIGNIPLANNSTRNSDVADRPHDASCHLIVRQVTQNHSRSFEMTLLRRV